MSAVTESGLPTGALARTAFRRYARALRRWMNEADEHPDLPTYASTVVAAKHGDITIVAATGRNALALTRWAEERGYNVQVDSKGGAAE